MFLKSQTVHHNGLGTQPFPDGPCGRTGLSSSAFSHALAFAEAHEPLPYSRRLCEVRDRRRFTQLPMRSLNQRFGVRLQRSSHTLVSAMRLIRTGTNQRVRRKGSAERRRTSSSSATVPTDLTARDTHLSVNIFGLLYAIAQLGVTSLI